MRNARMSRTTGIIAVPLAAVLLAAACLLPGVAAASTLPPPHTLDAPDNGTAPLVAYDPVTGTTYVAWSVPSNDNSGNGVDLCVYPADAAACAGGEPVLLTDPAYTGSSGLGLAGLVVEPDGEAVVLGWTNTGGPDGTVAWASPPGGGAFLTSGQGLQNGGSVISPVSMYYVINNAVALGNTDVGIFDSFDHFYSYFSDSPFAGPETPLPAALPEESGNANNGGQFDDQKEGAAGPVIAAEPAPPPAAAGTELVVGVGYNSSSAYSTPSGCVNYAASGYGVTAGTIGPSGTLNSQGLQPTGFSLLACAAEDPVLAGGGTDGIGVLEEEGTAVSGAGSDLTLDWRRFDATATGGSFGAPVELQDLTSHVLVDVNTLDVAEDSGAGVYALWTDEQGLVLDYSPNGGATWFAPVLVPALASGAPQGDPVITGVGGGTAEIAYDANLGTGTQVFLQTIDLVPPEPTTLTTTQASGTSTGANLSIPAGTVGETDQATLTGTNAPVATGTVTYNLYSNSSCTTLVAASGTAAVAAGKVGASAPVTAALVPGTYYWEAAYSGDVANDPSKSACGSEVLTVTPPSELGGSGSSSGTTVSVTISCAGPCTVTVTITVPSESMADASARKKGKSKPLTIATGKYSSKKGGKGKLKLKLTGTGKSLLKKDHGKLKASILLSDKTAHGTFKSTGTLKITPKRK